MSSCSKQKRATLVEWKGLPHSCHSRQGGSDGQYSDPSPTSALQTFQTATSPATQIAAAGAPATSPTGSAGAFGCPLFRTHLCRGLHRPNLLSLLGSDLGGPFDHRQPYHRQSPPHARHHDSGKPFELPPRLLQTTLVAVALGLPLDPLDHPPFCTFSFDSLGWS